MAATRVVEVEVTEVRDYCLPPTYLVDIYYFSRAPLGSSSSQTCLSSFLVAIYSSSVFLIHHQRQKHIDISFPSSTFPFSRYGRLNSVGFCRFSCSRLAAY